MREETQDDNGTRTRLETALPGSSSWMPYAPQGVKGSDDDEWTLILSLTSRCFSYGSMVSHDPRSM